MRYAHIVVIVLALVGAACHHQPVIDTGERPPNVGGTISGIVRASGGMPLTARKVTATNTATGMTFEQSTASNGGYTIKVPAGTYRLQVELHAGERVEKGPESTTINAGDLDAQRDFTLTVSAAP